MIRKGTKLLVLCAFSAAFMAFAGLSAQAAFPDGIEIRQKNFDGYDEAAQTRYGSGYVKTIGLGENDAQTYPELAAGLKTYSEDLKKTQSESFDSMLDAARIMYSETGELRQVYLHLDILPRRMDDTVFSFLTYYEDYQGGAHGYYMFSGHNFDTATGEELGLDQMITDEDAFRSAVYDVLMKKYPDSSIGTLGNPIDQYGSKEGQIHFNWVMGADKLSVYFNPYDIGSYAEGVFVADLPFADYPDLFTDKCQAQQGGYGMMFQTWTDESIDLDSDGIPSDLRVGLDYGNNAGADGYNWYESLSVYVDNNSCNAGDLEFYEAQPYLMKTADGRYYLYVVTSMENDYRQTSVFGFVGNSPYLAGTVSGSFGSRWDVDTEETICFMPSDPDHFVMEKRGDLLSTYTISRSYRVGEDGMPQPLEDFYTCYAYNPLRTVMALPAQPLNADTLEPEGDPIAIPAGEELKIRRTDGVSAVDMEREDGSMVRVTLDGSKWPRTIDGVDEGEYFEQEYYAG